MPRPIATADRLVLRRLVRQGLSVRLIARRLRISARSVQRLLARSAEQLAPSYQRCGRRLDPQRQAWQQAAVDLRRDHPGWGGQRLLLELRRQALPGTPPRLRTLQRWLARTGLPAALAGRRAAPLVPRANRPHQRWQLDAMDQVRLGNCQQASCLRVVDECTGAPLGNRVFSPRQLGEGTSQPDAGLVAAMV